MTNLSAGAGAARFSRERILTVVPLLIGSLTAGCLVVWQVLPTLERSRVLDDRLMQLRTQEQQLSVMRQQLEEANRALQTAQNRQAVLLDLIAGADRIQTFLALVDQLARATGIQVVRFEPLAEASHQTSEAQPPAEPRQEVMRSLGYRKTSIALQLLGSYGHLQRFLQSMESLEILVESSDLTLMAHQADPGDQREAMTAELSVRLSFYDRLPQTSGG